MTDRLPPGKVPWDMISAAVSCQLPDEVVLGPAVGEDAALVQIGGELWAVASDPISFTASDAGRLAVTVNANDVAVRGARPSLFVAVVLVAPDEATPDRVRGLLDQIRSSCDVLGVTLIGGHTEVSPGLAHSMVVGTMMGPVVDRAITTGGLQAGDLVGMTRWAGLEGTAILMAEFGGRLRQLHGVDSFCGLERVLGENWLSVVPEALIAAANPEVTALHDVTEGGVGEAVHELERASGLRIETSIDRIPLLPETSVICRDLGIDPLGLIGSGALLVGCRDGGRQALEEALGDLGVPLTWIGRAVSGEHDRERPVPRFERDEILKCFAVRHIQGVVFDMDGTLVASEYDWPAIRSRLGVTGASIIDELNDLPSPERAERWAELEEIERLATDAADLNGGVRRLISLFEERAVKTALVTNNSDANTKRLLGRFGLQFDEVLTRDSGLWKPSGAPVAEAMKRLGVAPDRCLVVGDSRYDVDAARAAGSAAVCLVNEGARRYQGEVDLRFGDVRSLLRYLEVVL